MPVRTTVEVVYGIRYEEKELDLPNNPLDYFFNVRDNKHVILRANSRDACIQLCWGAVEVDVGPHPFSSFRVGEGWADELKESARELGFPVREPEWHIVVSMG